MDISKKSIFILLACSTAIAHAKQPSVPTDIFGAIAQQKTDNVRVWLRKTPKLELTNQQGQTLLHAAVDAGNARMVFLLVKAGVQVNAVDLAGKTALDYALEQKKSRMARYLIKNHGTINVPANQFDLEKMEKKNKIYNRVKRAGLTIFGIGLGVVLLGSAGLCLLLRHCPYGR
jgi:ankyrin repeat protein